VSDVCTHACKHVDCAIARGDMLPVSVTRAWCRADDGSWIEYQPSAAALARHALVTRAREEAAAIEAAINEQTAIDMLTSIIDRAFP
jgi:hypothetical protein